MSTAIVTHKDCILHDTGLNHPESKERLIAINKTLKEFKSKKIKWFQGEKVESKYFFTVHSENYFEYIKNKSPKRSEEHTSELQSQAYLVCRLLLEKKNNM